MSFLFSKDDKKEVQQAAAVGVVVPAVTPLSVSKGGRAKQGRGRKGELRQVFSNIGDPMKFMRPVPSYRQVYKCVTTYENLAWLSTSSSSEMDLGQAFHLSFMNATELAGYQVLFDQYRIQWVEVMLVPRIMMNTGSVQNFGTLVTAVDYDSSAATTVANVITYTNALITPGVVTHYHSWSPGVTMLAGTSAGGSGSAVAVQQSPWLDLAVTTTPHYGLKIAITATDTSYVFDEYVRLHLEFRQKI